MAASAKKAPARAPAASTASAGEGLEGWTKAEKAAIRTALESNISQLRTEIAALREEIDELTADAASATGDDQADTGSRNFERDHELQVAQNAEVLLEQNERALVRLDEGTYGVCESCGQQIAKGRLQAYPSATLCVTCKSAQERR